MIAMRRPLNLTFSPEGEKEIAQVLSAVLSYPAAALSACVHYKNKRL
jgi:hypothetical protein